MFPLTKKSLDFEHLIERIHKLVEGKGSVVTWNDHVPDPENPDQLRQIDITIARDGRLTHVECRIHKAPQDVNWIEELVGRRASLRADAMIAVSASGFTKGAILKAAAYGIILRTLHSLSEEEIRDWGRVTNVQIVYYEFKKTVLTFRLAADAKVGNLSSVTELSGGPPRYRLVYQNVLNDIIDSGPFKDADERAVLKYEVGIAAPLLVGGVKPISMRLNTNVRRILRRLSLASVVSYAAPNGVIDLTESAYVQHYDLKGFEILQGSNAVGIVIDLSHAVPPPGCLFGTCTLDFGRIVAMRPLIEPIGLEQMLVALPRVATRIELS
jgi:hypothetical protein